MNDGDKNTKYFHRKASQRRRRNNVKGLFDKHDVWHEKLEDMQNIVAGYFSDLFATENPSNYDAALEGLECLVSSETNVMLDVEPSSEEIKDALFQMHPNKSPGPDGMHALFFQKFWHIIGPDIVDFVKSWWRGSIDLTEANKTCIVLIPKCNEPKK